MPDFCSFCSKRRRHGIPDGLLSGRRFKTGNNVSVSVDKELREIPFDVRFVVPIREYVQCGVLQTFAEAGERFLGRKERKQRIGCLAVDVDLFELREVRAECQRAEVVFLPDFCYNGTDL